MGHTWGEDGGISTTVLLGACHHVCRLPSPELSTTAGPAQDKHHSKSKAAALAFETQNYRRRTNSRTPKWMAST